MTVKESFPKQIAKDTNCNRKKLYLTNINLKFLYTKTMAKQS